MKAPYKASNHPNWLALPTGVLQHIFHLTSTWQTPGSCQAAPVCRTWRSAAAGCSSIQLLYHSGHTAADACLAAWLGPNSWQLEALILSTCDVGRILAALTEAAAAAQAAGRPLRLHTLRALQGYVDARTAGQLLARLPHLRCLQLDFHWPWMQEAPLLSDAAIMEALAPLQHATQLEELYLTGPGTGGSMAPLLPLSLKRLSWDPVCYKPLHDLSHLTQTTFLQPCNWPPNHLTSSQLPPGLQQLELVSSDRGYLELVEEQRQVVTAWDIGEVEKEEVQQLLHRLPKLRAASLNALDLSTPAAGAALQQATQLSAMTCHMYRPMNAAGMTMAAGIPALRRLHLAFSELPPPPALDVLTQLTQLRVSMNCPIGGDEQQRQQRQRAWAEVVGRMAGLQRLSVPDVLVAAGQVGLPWLVRLQQLRVLTLSWTGTHGSGMWFLEGCSREMLPRLQVLGVSGMTAAQATSWQLRRRLQRLLGSSGCEVVVGADLDKVADPTQQLAGLPAALQQVLA